MRIGFIVPRCTEENSHGRYVIELAKRLAIEHSITVYSGSVGKSLRPIVEYHWIPTFNRPAFLRLGSLWSISMLLPRSRLDIIHIQGADAPVGNVVTAHCCNAAMRMASGIAASRIRRWNYALGVAAERHCLSRPEVGKVIAVSERLRKDVQHYYGVDGRQTTVIPHGVDAEVFHPLNRVRYREPVRRKLGIGMEDFVIVFVGGDYALKGLPVLVDAIRSASLGLTVLAVGVHHRALPQGIRALGPPAGRVVAVGSVPDSAPYYAAADCFVLPTLYDTFSLATLEAMASGLPVIVSREAGVSEELTHQGEALLLDDPADAGELARHLHALVNNRGLRSRLGKEARRYAESLSWANVAERTLVAYGEVLNQCQ